MDGNNGEIVSETEEFEERFKSLMADVEGLPTLPNILWEVQASMKNKANGSLEIAMVIEQDLSLTGNILRLANSARFGGGERFISVADAVTRIGQREIERMINSTLLIDVFSEMSRGMDYTDFWCHNIQVAEIVILIADLNPGKTSLISNEVYMVGLLHDVGKLLLDQYFQEEFFWVREYCATQGCSHAEAELKLLGMEHGAMGACLLEYWNLSPQMIETIRYHHCVENCPEEHRADAALIRFGNELLHAHEYGELSEESLKHPIFDMGEVSVEALGALIQSSKDRALTLMA